MRFMGGLLYLQISQSYWLVHVMYDANKWNKSILAKILYMKTF